MRVQHGGVERSDEEIEVGDHDRHGAVDDALGAIHIAQRLVCEAGVVSRERQWRVPGGSVSEAIRSARVDNVRQVELRTPSDPGGRASRGRCHVTVVGTNRCNQY